MPVDLLGLSRTIAGSVCFVLLMAGLSQAAETVPDHDPCGLLTVAEVETVLGEPLAGPPFRSDSGHAVADGASCRYEASSFRAIDLEVEWSNGGQRLGLVNLTSGIINDGGLKGVVTLSNGTTLRGAWDEARDFLCCQFNALRGDQLVVVDIGASHASLEQAASLADLAVQRLNQPLVTDNAAGLTAALERDKTRPAIGLACDLVSRTEAEAMVKEPLARDPDGDDTSCTYAWVPPGADYTEQFTLNVTWRSGLSEMRQAQAAIGQAMSFMGGEGLAVGQAEQMTEPQFDEQATSIVGVMAVRKDVLLSVESGPMNTDLALDFITVAAGKF
jgi:hypothetical protein